MQARLRFVVLLIVSLLVLGLLVQVMPSGWTRLDVTEAGTGRKIVAAVLRDGEQIVLTWKNSLFGLAVTEEFVARGGMLVLTGVTFADPRGHAPVAVAPKDVDDLYQTGGPFSARGLTRPFARIVHRVGEIGDPKLRVRERLIAFKEEVGFGGGVVLTATTSSLLDRLLQFFAGGD